MAHKGFTFVETLIYVALIGITLTGFVAFALAAAGARAKNDAMREVNANANMALDYLSREIKGAAHMISPVKGGSGDGLILSLPDGEIVTIGAMDGILTEEIGGETTNITSPGAAISNLSFANLSGVGEEDNARILFTVSAGDEAYGKEFKYSMDLETAVCLRLK